MVRNSWVVWSTTSSQDHMWATERKSESPYDSQCICVRCFQGRKIFITEGSHSNVTVYDAEESNPSGVPAISNPPTHPPTYSVTKNDYPSGVPAVRLYVGNQNIPFSHNWQSNATNSANRLCSNNADYSEINSSIDVDDDQSFLTTYSR